MLRGDSQFALVGFSDLTQRRAKSKVTLVLDAPVFDGQTEVILAVTLFAPAQMVVNFEFADFDPGGERLAKALLKLSAKFFDTPVVHKVLHAGELAVFAVAVVALNGHDDLAGF